MKKILTLALAALMIFALVACNSSTKAPIADESQIDTPATDAPETDAPAVDTPDTDEIITDENAPASALEILEKIWAAYPEDQKFMAAGGFGDNMNWEGAGSIPTDDEEALATAAFYFVMDTETVAMADEIAHLMHGINQNTFTAGVFHLKDGADKNAFIDSAKAGVMDNHWMCGSPEKFVVITVGDFIITAYGHASVTEFSANTIPVFVETLTTLYPSATVVVEEAIGA